MLVGGVAGLLVVIAAALVLDIHRVRPPRLVALLPRQTDEAVAGVSSLRPSKRALPALPSPALESKTVVETLPFQNLSQPSVVFGMLIENLEYAQLLHAHNFYEAFNATVKQAVAKEAGIGIGSEDVQLAVSPGSVVVECTIAVGNAEMAESVQVAVGSSTTLAGALAQNLAALAKMTAMFQAVSTGRIAVTHLSEPVIFGTLPPSTTTTGLPTTTGPTRPTTPPPTRTTTRNCKPQRAMCFMHSQCCSARCSSMHRCAASLAGYGFSA